MEWCCRCDWNGDEKELIEQNEYLCCPDCLKPIIDISSERKSNDGGIIMEEHSVSFHNQNKLIIIKHADTLEEILEYIKTVDVDWDEARIIDWNKYEDICPTCGTKHQERLK